MKEKNIPLVAFIEVEGKKLPVKNWSEKGCTLNSFPEELKAKPWNIGNFIIPFEGFDLVIRDIRLEIEEDPSGVKCHFRYLPYEQENTLKSVINMYHMGQIFSIENLFNVIRKEKTKVGKTEEKKGNPLLPLITGIVLGILITYFIFKVL